MVPMPCFSWYTRWPSSRWSALKLFARVNRFGGVLLQVFVSLGRASGSAEASRTDLERTSFISTTDEPVSCPTKRVIQSGFSLNLVSSRCTVWPNNSAGNTDDLNVQRTSKSDVDLPRRAACSISVKLSDAFDGRSPKWALKRLSKIETRPGRLRSTTGELLQETLSPEERHSLCSLTLPSCARVLTPLRVRLRLLSRAPHWSVSVGVDPSCLGPWPCRDPTP
mmetsp:Transcript_35203/g.60286  ORF Transcript_35203/g.60286 Transcript_35203/m.60286 type:complete len:223 (+) Transcript_35203:522-1190(+)